MACYKPGYKVRTGVREGQFLPETEFLKSPSPSLFAGMERGGVRSHGERPSPVSGRGGRGQGGRTCPAPFSVREWSLLPSECEVGRSLVDTEFSKRFLLETDNSDSSSHFSKEVILKALGKFLLRPWGRLRGGSRQYSPLPGRIGTPEGWRPRRSGRRRLPPPGHGRSDETGTICRIFQGRSAQECVRHRGRLR